MDSRSSIFFFITKGLHPGSFCKQLLLRNREEAMKAAHPLLRDRGVVDTMLLLVETVIPDIFRTSDDIGTWCKHDGLEKAPDNQKVLFKLRGVLDHPVWDGVQLWNSIP